MGKILFDEQPIVVDRILARKFGFNEAVVIQQIHYWLKMNEKKNQNYIDNRYWTYNTLKEWHEKNFDFWSLDTVKRTFTKLENIGILLVSNFNKDRRDRTKWYSIDYEKLEELVSEKETNNVENCKSANCTNAKEESASCKSANCTNAKCTNAEGQIAPISKSAKCTNAEGQNAPSITRDYYTETTTEIKQQQQQEKTVVVDVVDDNFIKTIMLAISNICGATVAKATVSKLIVASQFDIEILSGILLAMSESKESGTLKSPGRFLRAAGQAATRSEYWTPSNFDPPFADALNDVVNKLMTKNIEKKQYDSVLMGS